MGDVEEVGFSRWVATTPLEERLERLVRGLTYQDGWTFTLTRGFSGVPFLVVAWDLADVHDPSRRATIGGSIGFRADYRDQALECIVYELWSMIGQFEAHERLERLHFDGKPIWDPHPIGSRDEPLRSAPDFAGLRHLDLTPA